MSAKQRPWLEQHVANLRDSYLHFTGRLLIPAEVPVADAARALDAASFAVVSHGTQPDPIFNYANRAALALFRMSWDVFVCLPSRLSAETMEREARAQLLERVARTGYADDYRGVRVAADGSRFMIEGATVWNVIDAQGKLIGQAARIERWRLLEA